LWIILPKEASVSLRFAALSSCERGFSQLRSRRTGARILPSRTAYTMGVAHVLVGVTGGIAAYKAPGVIRRLREAGHEVRVVATEAAFRFVPEETLSIAAGEDVHTDQTWWERSGRVEHISLARWADLVLVAPATADAMARAAIGLGDDLLSATILAGTKRVLWAPAMNPEMWGSPATRRNVETLKGWGHRFVGPAEGLMASAEEEPGVGRLAEEAEIVTEAQRALSDN
jgi:phosphopantothenoylcysteine decarboxylase/phosphopantothenate--cysteine ligase